jgi:hypothetical protein
METGEISPDRGNHPAGNTRLSIDRGSLITPIISFEISVIPPNPAELLMRQVRFAEASTTAG